MRKQYIAPQSTVIYITAASMLAESYDMDGNKEVPQWSNERDFTSGGSIWDELDESEE